MASPSASPRRDPRSTASSGNPISAPSRFVANRGPAARSHLKRPARGKVSARSTDRPEWAQQEVSWRPFWLNRLIIGLAGRPYVQRGPGVTCAVADWLTLGLISGAAALIGQQVPSLAYLWGMEGTYSPANPQIHCVS